MGKLVYAAIMSLDGFIADESGNFEWAVPDEEVHAFINEREKRYGTHLYGRVMYEMMSGWETDPSVGDTSPAARDFADDWQSVDKVVYSTTLTEPVTERTRIEPVFDPEAVRRLKAETTKDLVIGGPNLAAHAFAAGLIDECDIYLVPCLVGGGKPGLPSGLFISLELMTERRFGNGMVLTSYRVR